MVHIRVGDEHVLCPAADDHRHLGFWIPLPQRRERRRGKEDITDEIHIEDDDAWCRPCARHPLFLFSGCPMEAPPPA
jgi:hypothetical protein